MKNAKVIHYGRHDGACFTVCGQPRRQDQWTRDPDKITCLHCRRIGRGYWKLAADKASRGEVTR